VRWVVFGNGQLTNYAFAQRLLLPNDYIVCCDGGMRHAHALHITPQLIIGDMDSADEAIAMFFRAAGVTFESYPPEKDYTDLELAILRAIKSNASEILVLGATGGRLDHTLANMHALLPAAAKGIPATLADDQNTIRATCDKLVIEGDRGSWVSLIPADGEVSGISTEGLYYPLHNETLFAGAARGISNVMTDERAVITVKSGRLFIIQSLDS